MGSFNFQAVVQRVSGLSLVPIHAIVPSAAVLLPCGPSSMGGVACIQICCSLGLVGRRVLQTMHKGLSLSTAEERPC